MKAKRGRVASWLVRLARDRLAVGRLSYSQEGEDLLLARILETRNSGTPKGFYVDVGAHHPVRYSNTYYFYRRGWSGMDIDALPGTVRRFQRMRPRDIAVECGVGAMAGSMTYYQFNEPALNTFSAAEASRKNQGSYHLINQISVPVMPLAEVLQRYMPPGKHIDFMTIDTEGWDHEVIASNDWEKYRPAVLLVELLGTSLDDFGSHQTVKLLKGRGYGAIAKTFNTYFFVAE